MSKKRIVSYIINNGSYSEHGYDGDGNTFWRNHAKRYTKKSAARMARRLSGNATIVQYSRTKTGIKKIKVWSVL